MPNVCLECWDRDTSKCTPECMFSDQPSLVMDTEKNVLSTRVTVLNSRAVTYGKPIVQQDFNWGG